jgi:hypothetical protein
MDASRFKEPEARHEINNTPKNGRFDRFIVWNIANRSGLRAAR